MIDVATFSKGTKQWIFQHIVKGLSRDGAGPECYSCHREITAKNFAGVMQIKGDLAVFHGDLICLMQLSDLINNEEILDV